MKTFTFNELSQEMQEQATGRYWADEDYQEACAKLAETQPEEFLDFGRFAEDAGIKFNEHGERLA